MSNRERKLNRLIEEASFSIAEAVELLELAQLDTLRNDAENLLGRVLSVKKNPDSPDQIKKSDFRMIIASHLRAYIAGPNKIRVENSVNGDYTEISTTPAGQITYHTTGSTV
ncbi:hypothetical protein [Endozoicomonas ascidiicola]|uniref:hypothetical protein n=1 Tax=Endozoicomonas ascidiicola TaxID=1698521 RepID=UPI0008359395|nr:hypothetical protein [Endozoicomonas ascidiicola]